MVTYVYEDSVHFMHSVVYIQAPPSHEGTLAVSQRLTFLQPTFFGPSWSFTSDMAFGDTAYTTLGLGAHTDNTYFMSPSG